MSKAEGEALARQYGVQFLESSAKDNYNISEIFTQLGQNIRKSLGEGDGKQQQQKIKIDPSGGGAGKKKDCEC